MTCTIDTRPLTRSDFDARIDAARYFLTAIDPDYAPSDVEVAAMAGTSIGDVELRRLALASIAA